MSCTMRAERTLANDCSDEDDEAISTDRANSSGSHDLDECAAIARRGPTERRFFSRVDHTGKCWLWVGAVTSRGYGWFVAKGRQWTAHRFSWHISRGPIPDGLFVCHHCDTPRCVRPQHLFLGTHADNMADMKAKGRGVGRTTGRGRT